MARLDRIKNITGFVDWYGRSPALRGLVDLVVVAGHVDAERSGDDEEREQIGVMHHLMGEHGLDGQVRWLGIHLEKQLAGELYRYIADRRGAFVQPALFEAFGLTVIEAMSTGLPVFATCFGGPLEIIEDGISGFHIDPNYGDAATARMAEFFAQCREDPSAWDRISSGALARVAERYTWTRYANRLITLASTSVTSGLPSFEVPNTWILNEATRIVSPGATAGATGRVGPSLAGSEAVGGAFVSELVSWAKSFRACW